MMKRRRAQEATMTQGRFEVGLVSADRRLVDFYAHVFEREELPAFEAPTGTVHRLQFPSAVLKVMVPGVAPAVANATEPFFAMTGLRYLTIGTRDLDGVIERATGSGGRVAHGPMELADGVRLVVLVDPDGNTIEVIEESGD
jgi:predicted enzyme related to lactoylglutathione lyase